MSDSTAPTGPSVGRIIGSVFFISAWTLFHVALFYFFFVSGVLVDLTLGLLKLVLFPGAIRSSGPDAPQLLAWTGILQAGVLTAGAAGWPCGLAIAWQDRRRGLRRAFWLLLLLGGGCEVFALYLLVRNAFTFPA